ncbi:hypothetical protein [Actinomadura rupiterrae]|uniref:hypothetical protein n=1 Tax=Actinomadura rupiterrae TaxID=559627 RepID=UPI0020A2610F|nr:hypothetical protein [Actinomadura rupiterrae]MCP2340809.1 hypothetical protein [Actinomadura rupiterrae]
MRMRIPTALLTAGVMALTGVAATAMDGTAALAQGRRCGPGVSKTGSGSLGTGWSLKSMYDDDGPVQGQLVVGEEFEIFTQGAGQHWSVTFTHNGTVFFSNSDDVSTATGIREVHMTSALHNTTQTMNAHAVRKDTGEVIDGTVTLPFAPPACAPNSP